MWNIFENEIYVRVPAEQLLIPQFRVAFFECLGNKFDTFGAVPAAFRLFACNSSTIHSVSAVSGVETILPDKVLRARHGPFSSNWMAAFRSFKPHFEGREALLMDMCANCRHNGASRGSSLLNLVRLLPYTAAR